MSIVIKNGKVVTVTGKPLDNGVVVIEGGKITEIGENINFPSNAKIIDASGCYVTPGFIDCHTHLSVMSEPSTLPSPLMDVNEITDPITPQLRIMDSINPQDLAFEKVRSAGFTSACILPGSANIIGGLGVSVKLRGTTVDEMVIPNSEQMKMALGENPKRCYGANKIFPMTRMGNAAILRKTLFDVKNYIEKKETNKDDPSKQPTPDFKMESLIDVVKGKKRVRIHCHRADDIATAIRVAEEFNLDYTLEHATEGYIVKDFISGKKAQCVVGPLLLTQKKQELWNVSLNNAKHLTEAGVKVSLTADTSSETQWLPVHIGTLIKHGLSEEAAFKGVTIYPAEIMQISDRVGSLEVGKDADIAVFDGNPFCNFTTCKMTIIDGIIYESIINQ